MTINIQKDLRTHAFPQFTVCESGFVRYFFLKGAKDFLEAVTWTGLPYSLANWPNLPSACDFSWSTAHPTTLALLAGALSADASDAAPIDFFSSASALHDVHGHGNLKVWVTFQTYGARFQLFKYLVHLAQCRNEQRCHPVECRATATTFHLLTNCPSCGFKACGCEQDFLDDGAISAP